MPGRSVGSGASVFYFHFRMPDSQRLRERQLTAEAV
jgi:hypothetical protein